MQPADPTPTPDAPRATRREWIGLAVIALPCLLYSMDLTVLHLAVPQLTRDLKPTGAQLLWIIDIYGFLVAGSLVTAGTLGDRIGRRKLLLVGAALFGVASVLAAFSRSAQMLIATRALLGVAGATVAPSGALELAGELGPDAGRALTASAREAFVRGLQLCAGISAAGVLLLAAFVARALRDVPGPPAEPVRDGAAGDVAAA